MTLEFIFTVIFEIKVYVKNFLIPKNLFPKPDFHEPIYIYLK